MLHHRTNNCTSCHSDNGRQERLGQLVNCCQCSTVLAGEIAKLKMRQEKLELEELESSELSYL